VRVIVLVIAGVVAGWLAFVAWLTIARPKHVPLRATAELVPDAVRLIRRLATDRMIPRRARLPVWLLIGYLALPIDLVPDFLPVIGYADDVILVAVVLRGLIRRAGSEKVSEHWPGTPERLALFRDLLRLRDSE
jgi:uncharacterized membrane protein YkvA (DUF1232 family)